MRPWVRVAIIVPLYLAMLFAMIGAFIILGLAILDGGTPWMLIPMTGAALGAITVGEWWLPLLTRLTERKPK